MSKRTKLSAKKRKEKLKRKQQRLLKVKSRKQEKDLLNADEINITELEAIIERAGQGPLDEQERELLLSVSQTLRFVTEQLENKSISINRLRKLLFGASTETLKNLESGEPPSNDSKTQDQAHDDKPTEPKDKPKGHGRNGADAYTGAKKVNISHQTLKPGDSCPDGLSRNVPGEFKTLLANCLAHGRRRFVDIYEAFPSECHTVLETLAKVYKNDAVTHDEKLSEIARRDYHQQHSSPLMAELKEWMTQQLDDHLVEPNSGLGQAIRYMLKHWEPLTLFLRQGGAPLDNNLCERALKKAILNRKNAYYYRTANGARVGDMFMSLIHTCELNTVNPFDYLTDLQKHADCVSTNPNAWMPWNYQESLSHLDLVSTN